MKRCKPSLKKYSLRTQLLISFETLAAASLVVAVGVVVGTTVFIGEKAKSEARASLERQIERHLTDASNEAAATIGERFRKVQYGVLDVSAFALRDAIQEDLLLDGGEEEGYPLTPSHPDLRDTEIADSPNASLVDFYRLNSSVDLNRSVWYYSDLESFTVDVVADDLPTITQTARLDLLWPTIYLNANDAKAIYVGIVFASNNQMFRQMPGSDLSGNDGSAFACETKDDADNTLSGSIYCYDLTQRPWYTLALENDTTEADTQLGAAVITPPYIGAAEQDWMVTLARAVYSDSGSTPDDLLGVVGVDVKLEQVSRSVEDVQFLESGYSILVTADDGFVLASGVGWNVTDDTTVCDLGVGICSGTDDDGWDDLLDIVGDGGVKTFTFVGDPDAEPQESILVAAPVNATFETTDSGGEGTVTHYILSAVPKIEIYEPVEEMTELIHESTFEIIITTVIVASVTLLFVAIALCVLSGSITRPIVKMTEAARNIASRGAKTYVFGGVLDEWGTGRHTVESRKWMKALDFLLCRGEDEISTLEREFSDMITGLGRRGSVAGTTSLSDGSEYPDNPFKTNFDCTAAIAPPAPGAGHQVLRQ